MTIWADADSLPAPVRQLIARRALSRSGQEASGGKLRAVFVANRPLPVPPGTELLVVKSAGPDAVDEHILDFARPGDLVVTRDIPLAARLIEVGVAVLNDRGDAWTPDTVRERLGQRDFMAGLRATGLAQMNRSRGFGAKETKAFADALDRTLTIVLRT